MTFKTRSKFVHLALDFLPHVFFRLKAYIHHCQGNYKEAKEYYGKVFIAHKDHPHYELAQSNKSLRQSTIAPEVWLAKPVEIREAIKILMAVVLSGLVISFLPIFQSFLNQWLGPLGISMDALIVPEIILGTFQQHSPWIVLCFGITIVAFFFWFLANLILNIKYRVKMRFERPSVHRAYPYSDQQTSTIEAKQIQG